MAAVASATLASTSSSPSPPSLAALSTAALATQCRRCSSSSCRAKDCRALVLGGDLGEYVDAVDVLFDHPLQAPDLALDPAQPLQVLVLLLGVPVAAVGRRGLVGRLAPLVAAGGRGGAGCRGRHGVLPLFTVGAHIPLVGIW